MNLPVACFAKISGEGGERNKMRSVCPRCCFFETVPVHLFRKIYLPFEYVDLHLMNSSGPPLRQGDIGAALHEFNVRNSTGLIEN